MPYMRVRGRVAVHLADPDTDPPAAPSVAYANFPAAWSLFGDSFFDNEVVRFMRDQTMEDEEALNELEPVDVWRTSDVKRVSGRLKDFTLETLQVIFNNNAITNVAAQGGNLAYSQMSLDADILVEKYAVLVSVDSSPYDSANVHTTGFRTQLYLPNGAEVSNFDSPLSPKHTAMVPFEFKGYKSQTTGKTALIRMTKM